LGFKGVDHNNPQVEIIHCGRYKVADKTAAQVAETPPGYRADVTSRRCGINGFGQALETGTGDLRTVVLFLC
jgi:hypothetical protein